MLKVRNYAGWALPGGTFLFWMLSAHPDFNAWTKSGFGILSSPE